MEIQVKKINICTRKSLKKKLIEGKKMGYDELAPHIYYYVMGCYDSHWFGICVYRNSIKWGVNPIK